MCKSSNLDNCLPYYDKFVLPLFWKFLFRLDRPLMASVYACMKLKGMTNVECRLIRWRRSGIASGLGLRSSSYDPTGRLWLRPDRSLSLF